MAWLDKLQGALSGPAGYLDPDTYFNAATRESAWLAAGSACVLSEALWVGDVDVGMLLARPPGHHATRDRAMGFCVLNTAAVAAAHALSLGARRIAIVDWDVHHGNGTQAIFYDDPRVLFVSLHESPMFPDTGYVHEIGAGEARGCTVNLPLPGGCDGGAYALAFERVVLPIVHEAAPDLLIISAGFDAHADDPLASMLLRRNDFRWMAAQLRSCAPATAKGRVLVVFEGGYDLGAVESGVEDTVLGLCLRDTLVPRATQTPQSLLAEPVLRAVERTQKAFWPSLR
jgi:acetoin utilization deacetylase AcuC-like enzyme